jgi:hypothetical protein
MSRLRVLYHMARADFLERSRRYSFLIMLGLVLYLGYTVNAGQITLRLDAYRGIFNSAWAGSMITLVVNFFLGWFGFYLVKNAIARDYETGVGQIMATTPLTRPLYALGKWLSNFAVLGVMVFILMLAAVVMQLLQREDPQLNIWALVAPILFVALPFMALVAAIAVLFESIHWLRGGFGNLVYFFFFGTFISVLTITVGPNVPLLDWLGFGLFSASMGEAARAVYPDYQGGFSLGVVPPADMQTFYWPGINWTLAVVLPRLATLALGIGTALLGSLFFDRFDPSRERRKLAPPAPSPEPAAAPAVQPAPGLPLSPLPVAAARFRFGALLLAELRMLLKGLPWWWLAVAAGLITASVFSPLEIVRRGLLPAAWIWPILLWSSLGSREARHDTRQMVFSAPHPLGRQLPAAWLAGFVLAVLMGAGAAVKLSLAGDVPGLISLLAGALFVPSLALALGVWTGSSKAFEIIYTLWWYAGPMNGLLALDYIGVNTREVWPFYMLMSAILCIGAVIGRERQLRNL